MSSAELVSCNLKAFKTSGSKYLGTSFFRTALGGVDFSTCLVSGLRVSDTFRELRNACFFSQSSCGAFNAPWNKNKIILAAMTINVTAAFYHFYPVLSVFSQRSPHSGYLLWCRRSHCLQGLPFERSTFHIAVITAPQRTCLAIPTEKTAAHSISEVIQPHLKYASQR